MTDIGPIGGCLDPVELISASCISARVARSGIAKGMAAILLMVGIVIGGIGYYAVTTMSGHVATSTQTSFEISTSVSVMTTIVTSISTQTGQSTTISNVTTGTGPALSSTDMTTPLMEIVPGSAYLASYSTASCSYNFYTPLVVRLVIENLGSDPITNITASISGSPAIVLFSTPTVKSTTPLYQYERAAVEAQLSPTNQFCARAAITIYATDQAGNSFEQSQWVLPLGQA